MASRITLTDGRREFVVDVDDDGHADIAGARLAVDREAGGQTSVTDAAGETTRVWAVRQGDRVWVYCDGEVHLFETQAPGWSAASGRRRELLAAPMPASVRQVLVSPGDTVAKGDILILLEAMKMELPIRAGRDATVRAVHCQPGDLVQPGVSLLDLDDA